MKKLLLILSLLFPIVTIAQKKKSKPPKPSVVKAEAAFKSGNLAEAKSIIDITTANTGYMVNKKGEPSKNAAKSWFVKGLIYMALDTTQNEDLHSIKANAYDLGVEAFQKSKTLTKDEDVSFITEPNGFLPLLNSQVFGQFGQFYYDKAITEYQDKKDYSRAFEYMEKVAFFIPNDTTVLQNAGVYFGPAAEKYEKSLKYIDKYIAQGGGSQDAYIQMFSIYRDKLKDNEKALKVIKEAELKFPDNPEFPKFELDMYIKMDRLPDAKVALENQLAGNPDDKEGHYYLGVINSELGGVKAAKECYTRAIDIDESYFEPRLALADLVSQDTRDVKSQMNQLGISAEDNKKRFQLDKVYVEKLKYSLPYWQICEKLSPDDSKVLDVLLGIHKDLGNQSEVNRLTKHMKSLGLFD